MIRNNPCRWQAPGNGRIFDSQLEEWETSKMSQRSIGVMQFLKEYHPITKEDFELRISDYLEQKYGHEFNDSNKAHFYRPLEFLGFIRNLDNELSVSINGQNFLNCLLKRNYSSALEFFILQLFQTSYPNNATPKVKLSLFPFRIMFKLLSESRKGIPRHMFLTEIPYIKCYNDIQSILTKLSDDFYLNKLEKIENNELEEDSEKYYKWNSWIVSSLEKLNILKAVEDNDYELEYIKLAKPTEKFIENKVIDIKYEGMFFDDEEGYESIKNPVTKKTRNPAITNNVLETYKYQCFFDKRHETFPGKNRQNYVEGHHIIPISYSDSFSEELDCEENIIPLCPNCHKAMHHSINEYKLNLLLTIMEKKKDLNKFNITIEDLKEIYFNK